MKLEYKGPSGSKSNKISEKFQNEIHFPLSIKQGLIRGVVTLCARCARAHPLFGSDKCKDLCGHTHFLLRNVPEKDINSEVVTGSARFDIYGWNFDFNSSKYVFFHEKQLWKYRLFDQRSLSTSKPSIFTFKIDPFCRLFFLLRFPVKNDLSKDVSKTK